MTPDSSRDHKPLKYIPPVFIFVSPSLVFNTQILILNSFIYFFGLSISCARFKALIIFDSSNGERHAHL